MPRGGLNPSRRLHQGFPDLDDPFRDRDNPFGPRLSPTSYSKYFVTHVTGSDTLGNLPRYGGGAPEQASRVSPSSGAVSSPTGLRPKRRPRAVRERVVRRDSANHISTTWLVLVPICRCGD